MHLPRETRAFLLLVAGMAMADWLVLICQHRPQPPCQTPSPPRSCPSPPSRLPFRAAPPMTTTRSRTVCPGLAAHCAGAIDASHVRLVAGLARGRGPRGVLPLWAAHSMRRKLD